MNPFDFFHGIYCINLDKRVDRWKAVQEEFEKIGIKDKVNRFSAVENSDGRIGCIKSHLEILKIARKNSLKNVLVFEDDVVFINDTLNTLNKSIKQINMDWKLFYLGANTHEKLTKITKNIVLIKNAFATHAICYDHKIFDTIISKIEKINQIKNHSDILDVWMATNIQTKHICLGTNPIIATQKEDFSDIEGKVVNYKFIEERFKNNTK